MKKLLFILFLFAGTLNAQLTFTVESYGANGTDASADGTAIQNAMNAAGLTSNVDTVVMGAVGAIRNYIIDQTIEVNKNTYIKVLDTLNNKVTVSSGMAQTGNGMFRVTSNSPHYSASVSISVVKGSFTLSLTNAETLLDVGDILFIQGGVSLDVTGSADYMHGIYERITALSGNTITVARAHPATFTATTATAWVPKGNVTFDGIRLDARGRRDGFGFHFDNVVNSTMKNCYLQGDLNIVTTAADHLILGVMLTGIGITFQDNFVENIAGWTGYGDNPYAVGINGSDILAQRNRTKNAYAGIVSGTRAYYCQDIRIIYNTHVAGAGIGIAYDLHGNSSGEIGNNDCTHGPNQTIILSARFNNTRVHHNTIRYNAKLDSVMTTRGIWTFEATYENLSIDSNLFIVDTSYEDKWEAITQFQGKPITNFKIRGNVFNGGGTVELKDTLANGFEFSGNFFNGNTKTNADPQRFWAYNVTTGTSLFKKNTWIIRADHGGSDWNWYFADDDLGNFLIDSNYAYYPATNTTAPYKFNGGGYVVSNNIKYSSSGTQFTETGGANTKTNNTVVGYTSSPALPTYAGVGAAGSTNQAPTANANNDQVTYTSTATLYGTGTDPDGTIVSYQWALVSGLFTGSIVNANASTTDITGVTNGTYVFRLTVTDDDGATDTDDVTITKSALAPATSVILKKGRGSKIRYIQQ